MKNSKAIQMLGTLLIMLVTVLITMVIGLAILAGGFRGVIPTLKYAMGLGVIQQYFVGDYDLHDVTDQALAGAVAALDDRWSYYMDPEAYADYQDMAANRYQGIGVTITPDEGTGGFLILAVTKDGPAQLAGILEGDIILAVDGVDVTGGTTEDLKALIQADYGREAMVTVLRSHGAEETVAVSCQEVYTSPVDSALLEETVGYVRITNFRAGAGEEVIAAVEELLAQGAEALVFDVRSNPGGQVSEMTALLDYLLPQGDVFVHADRRGREVREQSDEECLALPMAVVVNGDSYSAAEYFAATLREYDWALVVGEATTGKSRSQVTVALWDESAIHLSRYSYLTPEGVDLYEAGGLTPDVEAALTEEERLDFDTGWLEPAEDPQIRAAIAALDA